MSQGVNFEEFKKLRELIQEAIDDMEDMNISYLKLRLGSELEIELGLSPAPLEEVEHTLSPEEVEKFEESTSKPPEEKAPNRIQVKSLTVGYYRSLVDPEQPLSLYEGKVLKKGDPLGAIEGLSFVQYIKSPVDGILRKVFVSDEEPVDYDRVLFEIEPLKEEGLDFNELEEDVIKLERS